MTGILGWIIGGGVVAILAAIGGGIMWLYDSAYSAGKKSAKLAQAQKEIDDAQRAGQILGEQRTTQDTQSSLNNGTF